MTSLKNKKISPEKVTRIAVALWRLMGEPNLDKIPLSELLSDQPTTVVKDGKKEILQPEDLILRGYLSQLIQEALLQPAYLQTEVDLSGVLPTTSLSQLGVLPTGFDHDVKVKIFEYYFKRHMGAFVSKEAKEARDQETFSFLSPYFQSGDAGYYVKDHPKFHSDRRASLKPADFLTVRDYELFLQAERYLIQLSQGFLEDRAFQEDLSQALASTKEMAKDLKWGTIHGDFLKPGPLKPVPLSSGDLTFFAGWLLGLYQRAVAAAADKNPQAYQIYLRQVMGPEMIALKKDFREAVLTANRPYKYGQYYNDHILTKEGDEKLTLIDLPKPPRSEKRSGLKVKELERGRYVEAMRGENNPTLPLSLRQEARKAALSAPGMVALVAGGIVEDPKNLAAIQELVPEKNLGVIRDYEDIRSQLVPAAPFFAKADTPGVLGVEMGVMTPAELETFAESVAGLLILQYNQGIQLFLPRKGAPQALIDAIKPLETKIRAYKDAKGTPIGNRFVISLADTTSEVQKGFQTLSDHVLGAAKKRGTSVDLANLKLQSMVFLRRAGSLLQPEVKTVENTGTSEPLVKVLESVVSAELSEAGQWEALSPKTKQALEALDRANRQFRILSEGLAAFGAEAQVVALLKAAVKIAMSA